MHLAPCVRRVCPSGHTAICHRACGFVGVWSHPVLGAEYPLAASTSSRCSEHPDTLTPPAELSRGGLPTPTAPHIGGRGNGLGSGSLEPRLSCIICPHPTVTGESPPSLSKELSSTLAGVSDVSFDSDHQFPLDELKIDPLTLDGLHMLNDPDMVLADPATEDTFRMDRL